MIATEERRFARLRAVLGPPAGRLFERLCAWSDGGRNRKGRSGAVAFSVLAHLLLLTAALGAAQGRSFSVGEGQRTGDAEGVRVSLEGLDGLPAEYRRRKAKPRTPAAELEALRLRLSAGSPKSVDAATERNARSSPDLMDLFERDPRTENASAPGHGPQGDAGRGSAGGSTAGETTARADASDGPSGGAALASGALWNQVARCWWPDEAAVPVVLEVTLDGAGRIAVPPKIIRPADAALNERRLISETRAIQAVASCAPFRGMTGRRAVRFEFPTSRRRR